MENLREWARLDLLHEVEHMGERVKRLEQAITEAVKLAPAEMLEVIRGLQALCGIAEISAVTIVAATVRAHWAVENRLHWCMDIAFNDDQMRARTRHAAHNPASLKQLTLNLIRMDPVKRKGGIKARRIIAATSDNYRAHLLGLG